MALRRILLKSLKEILINSLENITAEVIIPVVVSGVTPCQFIGQELFYSMQWSVDALRILLLFYFGHRCTLLHTTVAAICFCIGFGGDIQGTGYAYVATFVAMKLESCKLPRAERFPKKQQSYEKVKKKPQEKKIRRKQGNTGSSVSEMCVRVRRLSTKPVK